MILLKKNITSCLAWILLFSVLLNNSVPSLLIDFKLGCLRWWLFINIHIKQFIGCMLFSPKQTKIHVVARNSECQCPYMLAKKFLCLNSLWFYHPHGMIRLGCTHCIWILLIEFVSLLSGKYMFELELWVWDMLSKFDLSSLHITLITLNPANW